MGIEYSTNNYTIIENVIDKQPVILCSIDMDIWWNPIQFYWESENDTTCKSMIEYCKLHASLWLNDYCEYKHFSDIEKKELCFNLGIFE